MRFWIFKTFPSALPTAVPYRRLNRSPSLSFPSDKLCIIGETGSGKSILLLSVLRLLPASAVVSGDVCFHGQSLFALSPKQMDGVRGGQISPMCRREAATA